MVYSTIAIPRKDYGNGVLYYRLSRERTTEMAYSTIAIPSRPAGEQHRTPFRGIGAVVDYALPCLSREESK